MSNIRNAVSIGGKMITPEGAALASHGGVILSRPKEEVPIPTLEEMVHQSRAEVDRWANEYPGQAIEVVARARWALGEVEALGRIVIALSAKIAASGPFVGLPEDHSIQFTAKEVAEKEAIGIALTAPAKSEVILRTPEQLAEMKANGENA